MSICHDGGAGFCCCTLRAELKTHTHTNILRRAAKKSVTSFSHHFNPSLSLVVGVRHLKLFVNIHHSVPIT